MESLQSFIKPLICSIKWALVALDSAVLEHLMQLKCDFVRYTEMITQVHREHSVMYLICNCITFFKRTWFVEFLVNEMQYDKYNTYIFIFCKRHVKIHFLVFLPLRCGPIDNVSASSQVTAWVRMNMFKTTPMQSQSWHNSIQQE